jgi:anti-anti-sigma regulatory factor
MNTISMNKFGRTLTDREYGKKVAETILQEATFPVVLDFKGVITLGSSCGDEILNAIAPKQNFRVQAANANEAIKSCLEKVAEDSKFEISFLP